MRVRIKSFKKMQEEYGQICPCVDGAYWTPKMEKEIPKDRLIEVKKECGDYRWGRWFITPGMIEEYIGAPVKEDNLCERKWAKNITDPEKIKVFRASCEKIIEKGGDCTEIPCDNCPGNVLYNYANCFGNGFRDRVPREPLTNGYHQRAVQSAKAYLAATDQHSEAEQKPKPTTDGWPIPYGTFCRFSSSELPGKREVYLYDFLIGIVCEEGEWLYIPETMPGQAYKKARPVTSEELGLDKEEKI